VGNTVVEKPTPSVVLGGVTSGSSANKPQDAAQGIIDAATTESLLWGTDVDTAQMAEEIVAMRRTNPDQAVRVEAEIARINPDAGFQSRLYEDIRTITEYSEKADNRLQTLGSDGTTPTATITDRAQISGTADQLLAEATEHVAGYRTQPSYSYVDVSELVYRVEVIAEGDPQLAQVLRSEITGRLSPADAATFNRFLAGEKTYGEMAASAAQSVTDFQVSVVTGAASAGYDAVTGTVILAGNTLQYGADSIPIVGPAGDNLREWYGEMPGWADAIIPSDTRGSETTDNIVETATVIKDYTYSRIEDPSLIRDDFNGVYNNVTESYAAAAAEGTRAEWWGNLTGRAAFELAALAIPASKLGNLGKIDNLVGIPGTQTDELIAIAPTQADGVIAPVSRQADELIRPNVARLFSVYADNLPAGNKIIEVDGQYWNLPAGKSLSDLPLTDTVGDTLQSLTTESAARWAENPWGMLSSREFNTVLRKSDLKGLATLLLQQAKGRWIESLVKGIVTNDGIGNQNLIWSSRGLDMTNLSDGYKYDIMSGTQENLIRHANREPNQIFRLITF
jgi:hypothetical protein